MSEYKLTGFYKNPEAQVKKRAGYTRVGFRRESLFKRIKRWFRGEPNNINSMVEYEGVLMVASDKGLYYYDGEKMKRVECEWDKPKEMQDAK